jgi:hypothetical protein
VSISWTLVSSFFLKAMRLFIFSASSDISLSQVLFWKVSLIKPLKVSARI